jgi:glucose-1-phosphate thymidylyltransferase
LYKSEDRKGKERMKVIMPMAGLGTRLRPHTHTKPKPLLQVAGKAVLDHILDRLEDLDIQEVVFIVGYLGEQIKEHVEANYDFATSYVQQKEPKGQAHALYLARQHLRGPVFIIFVDTIFEGNLRFLKDISSDGVAFVKEVDDPSRFGVVTLEEGFITRFVEKPDEPISNLALVGMYYIKNSSLLLDCIEAVLREGIKTKGEYYLADALQVVVNGGAKLEIGTVEVWQDCGTPETLLTTNRYLLRKSGGQEIETNNSVIIPPVHIAPSASITNSIIGPYVSIAGEVVIEDSIISDSIIDEEAQIQHAMLRESLVGTRAWVRGSFKKVDIGDDSSVDLG